MAETKYGKYILTEITPFEHPSDRASRVFYLDDEVIKGAFYVECAWCLKGSDESAAEPHAHNFDEVIGFLGTNPEDPHNLYGEIEFWLGDEKHILTKSCLIFVPEGLKHCPLIIRRADRPIFHFATGTKGTYIRGEQ
jgi:hypothetical protein